METKFSFSDIKNLLIEIGFHYSWGYFISNKNKAHRIKIQNSNDTFIFYITKRGNYFDNNKFIIEKKEKLSLIKNKIITYFDVS